MNSTHIIVCSSSKFTPDLRKRFEIYFHYEQDTVVRTSLNKTKANGNRDNDNLFYNTELLLFNLKKSIKVNTIFIS